MQILGVTIHPVSKDEALRKLSAFLEGSAPRVVVTPNPEIIMRAHRDPAYRAILNRADLALPDGAGIVLISRLLNMPVRERVTGADIVPGVVRLAAEKGLRVALVGGRNQHTITKAAAALGPSVVFAAHGVPKRHWNDEAEHEKMIEVLRASAPHVVLVAFGAPKQEQWIARYRDRIPSVRLWMGIGGALEFASGAARRAPSVMRAHHFEWLWRLIHEPRRIRRILTAVIAFPLTVLYAALTEKKR